MMWGRHFCLQPPFRWLRVGHETSSAGRRKGGCSQKWLPHILFLCATAYAQTLPQAESAWKAKRYDDANNVFRALVGAQPNNPDYKVRWGRLLLERFNKKDSADLFNEALEIKKDHAGALLGLALVAAEDFENQAVKLAHKALEADPKLLEAQELLARLALEDTNEKLAIEEADKAIAMSPRALDAMSIRAAIDWLHDKPDTDWIHKIIAIDPHYGKAYETGGHFQIINRRYVEGIALYRAAIAAQPDLWSAHSELGVNLMRLGEDDEARAELVKAYQGGFTDAITSNSLTLLDSYKNFNFYKSDSTVVKLHKKESELLRPYIDSELKRCLATYEKKYKMHIDRPIQLEVYPDHADFEVRTAGLPGLGGILGVTFGYIVAMDSPTTRKPGTFHWAATMWHEMSHVYVLAATKHRVPRWFTEGMAVHEESAVSPEWGDRIDPMVLHAIKDKKLLPVAELDRGFIRPTYGGQVIVSYFQAGRICDYINEKWGWDKLLAMMHDFAKSESTADVIQKELGIAPEEFDKQFLAALEKDTKKTVDALDDWLKKLKEIYKLSTSHQWDDVIKEGTPIRDLYPDYVEAGSVYELLADAYIAKENKPAAIAELERYQKQGGRSPATLKKLATLLAEAGRKKDAAATLERINYIAPQDDELHKRLGDLDMETGNVNGAIMEFTAALAQKPLDEAASHYNLARALRQANRTEQAKDQLLQALEAAPGFKPAQKMLLEISR
jgi:tetratricopeptide (TPR) repeat protein